MFGDVTERYQDYQDHADAFDEVAVVFQIAKFCWKIFKSDDQGGGVIV